jgi:hypothetical protein
MTAEKKEIELRGRCGTCLFNGLLLKHETGVVAFEKEGCSLGQRVCVFLNFTRFTRGYLIVDASAELFVCA